MGTLMAVGFMVLPAVTARLWVQRIGPLIALATVIALLASVLGLLLSYGLDSPTSPSIVLVFGVFYVFSMVLAPQGLWFRRHALPHREA
jgi:zinc/manganese transport system permease protein